MVVEFDGKSIDLENVAKIYPAAIVKDPYGGNSPISLEWAKINQEKVEIIGFKLFFQSKEGKTDIFYATRRELDQAMARLAELLQKANSES